jgi:hypothetical protein
MNLDQEDVHGDFEALGTEVWTTVCDSWHDDDTNGGIYCGLALPKGRTERLGRPEWDIDMEGFSAGFSQHRENGQWVTTYLPYGAREDFEPLVIIRIYHGVVPSRVELAEQFRLYHNLYWDDLASQFFKPNDDGTSSVAAKISGYKVTVRTKLIRQYQAARQLDFMIYIDSRRFGSKDEEPPPKKEWATSNLRASLFPSDPETRPSLEGRCFTRYLGSKVLTPPPVERSGIWPYEEEDDYFPEFIIGVDADGDEISYTCNPGALANYFGANPDAPNYLTPVHFRREVLRKYYDKPELYTVSDGRLSCASLWGIQIDNSAQDSVVVFLGDLGRDLPRQERDYWRSFNIPPDSPASETFIRRSFLAQFTEPTASDLQLRSQYVSFRDSWRDYFGWDLFLEPEEADAGLLQRLRIPLDESQAEFEASIRILTQLLVDAINEKQIQSLLPDRRKDEKGISKLQRWLEQEDYPHVDRDIAFLRRLQKARSEITAHRKGSKYEATLEELFGKLRGSSAIRNLFESGLLMIAGLDEWVASRRVTQDTK